MHVHFWIAETGATVFSSEPNRGHWAVRFWWWIDGMFLRLEKGGHRDLSLLTWKSACPRNSPNGEFRGSSRERNSGVELKRRIQRTEKPGFLRRFCLKTGLSKSYISRWISTSYNKMVARTRIELVTQGFSVLCSTNWATPPHFLLQPS